MNNSMKVGLISALLALGVGIADAQTTNVTLAANFSLSGFKQTGDTTATAVRITNKDIFNTLNASSNGFAFGRTAKLMIISSQGGSPTFIVREKTGSNVTDTDISSFVSVSTSDIEVVGNNGNTHYTILSFRITDGGSTDITVSGFATLRHGRISGHGIGNLEDQVVGAAIQVAGSGVIQGDNAVVKGTVSASGARAELAQ